LFNIKPIAIPVKSLTVPMSRSLPVVVVKKKPYFLRVLHIPRKLTLLLYFSMPGR